MAKKSLSKKSVKSLFSRSEANLDESVERDASKNEGEKKKKFKFFKLKTKSKNSSSPEKAGHGSQQVLSAAEPSNCAGEDGEAWAAGKKAALYSTAPRSKGKEFSYSEMDLRKPKRFGTFSFGLKKRKRRDEDSLSKSTFGLHSPGIGEHEETNLDLSQVELDQSKTKMTFSMSQPELDTSDTFDIPSPPAVGKNQSGSSFTIPDQPPQSFVSENTLINSSAISDAYEDTPKAPIASIEEFQLDDEELNAPVHHNSSDSAAKSPAPVTHTESVSVVDTQPAPCIPADQPPVAPDTSDQRAVTAAAVDHCDNDSPQQPYIKTEISLPDSINETLTHPQPDAPDIADSAAPSNERFLTSADSKPDATNTDSTPVPRNDISTHSVTEGVSDSHVKRSAPEAANSVKTTSDISNEKTTPRNEDAVYGALYESLFPESFTTEIMSSLSALPAQIHTEVRHVNTKPEHVMVKTLEHHKETTITYSCLPPSHDSVAHGLDQADSGYASTHDNVKVPPRCERFTSYRTSTSTDFQANTDQVQHRCLPSSLSSASEAASRNFPYSELTPSHSELRLDSSSPIHHTVGSVPVSQNSAPPATDYVTSQGTDTQVTDSKRRVILVKESVSDEASPDSGCPSPVPDKMSAGKSLELKIEAREGFGSGQTDIASPVYLSVGSDDGSAMEIYYSAEEDNAEESGEEEMYTVDEREETYVVDGMKGLEQGEMAERGGSKRDERDLSELNVRDEGEIEVQQHLRGQRVEAGTTVSLESSDAEIQEEDMATTALPQMEDEEEEEGGGEEELLATPVQQVNTLMVCEVSPPSSGPHVQGEWPEGNWTGDMETEDHLNGERQLPGQEIRYLPYKDDSSAECTHAASSNTSWEDVITPTSRETEEQVSLSAEQRREETNSNTTSAVADASNGAEVVTGSLTHCTELQPNATETQHNSAPQSSEWADTIPQNTNRKGMVQEQVAVELSDSNIDTYRPDTEPAEALSERREHPAAAQSDLNQGFSTASGIKRAASEVLPSESQETEADQGSVDKMNSGYNSLSTKLTVMSLNPPKEDESRNRFRKVSLITEGTDGLSQDTAELTKTTTVTESNGEDLDSQYRWRNRFEDVSPYISQQPEYSSLSDSERYKVPDTDSSALPETTTYKLHSSTFSSTFSTPTSEEDFRLSSRLSEKTTVYLNHESEQEEVPKYVWRRSQLLQEEPAAPAGEGEGEAVSERIKSQWESQHLSVSGYSSVFETSCADSLQEEKNDGDSDRFTGLFKATLVELDSGAAHSSPPASPDTESLNQSEMDNLVDTLKNMGPSMRPRSMGLRMPPQTLISSLPPIVEDAHSPAPTDGPASQTSPIKTTEMTSKPDGAINGGSLLPADLGLKRSTPRDTRSPLELMKKNQQEDLSGRVTNFASRVSTTSNIGMISPPHDTKSPTVNGNGLLQSNHTGSRLDTSVIFGGFKSPSFNQTVENGNIQRPLYRAGSLPETGLTNDRMSTGLKQISDQSHTKDAVSPRFDRFSFFLNASSSGSGSLTGAEDSSNARISRPPSLGITSPPSINTPNRLLSPTASMDIHKSIANTDSPPTLFSQMQVKGGMAVGTGTQGTPILHRSFSSEGTMGVQQTSLFNSNSAQGGSLLQSKEPEPDKNILCKYRAFPDAYLTKEKEHGKLNPRPGKMYIFDQPGMCGQRIEVRSDVIDATPWNLQETISIRVVRGGWVLYEKPNFKGEKIALDEGDIELTYPFGPPEEPQQNGEIDAKPARKFIIGSIRRAVRDYSVPEISLFPEANAEGKKVIFRDTSDDARIFGFPIKATSIIINAGLWLVYAQPFFQGVPRVLEVGGYPNPAAWGVEQPYVGSLHPLKIAEPRVENVSEPKIVIFDKPYFSGKSRTITTNMKDFMTRVDKQQTAFMYSVGSIKVMGGIWVGYEKENFRGHQYLLEEGEFHDWRVWGGYNSELRSVRVIKADLTDPMMVMFEQLDDDQENMEENTFEVSEAIPDVELFDYKTSTRSIHVLSGAWIAYSHVDFSGNQYILEKGFYNNCADWGSADNRICSVQPILLAPGDSSRSSNEIILYSEPDFLGECRVIDRNQEEITEKFLTKSCRVVGGNWVVYNSKQYSGELCVLSEGEYPNFSSMGCPSNFAVRSVKVVPMTFAVPSISLFGLEGLEGREITTETDMSNMAEEGFNNHILSVRVNSGSWVICEHSNYRGRQFLLETIEIPNWPKFSSLNSIGSIYPVRQKRHFFRIKNKASGFYMSIQGGLEEMKSGRVVVTAEVEQMSDIWFYHDGFIKNKLSQTVSLQVMGNVEPAAKVVMWSEARQPFQTWSAKMRGLITSLTFPGMVLDIKGGKTYDKDHVVIMPETEERPSQQWDIELL